MVKRKVVESEPEPEIMSTPEKEPIVEPIVPSVKESLLALVNSAPELPELSGPTIDPIRELNIQFLPKYRVFINEVRRLAERL